ncbi:MAG: class I SAM-dependent methyltransferase [Aulosira sp. ZfuVER01]|nr:class I SAM-dependent methyltransferase [Aulosira sp. ZfuVER01]MDZ8000768.1 class I SAM-dependent methyltransferase [Aulosira sp. DedVER01a]MDZ8055077.1 class I SAM-dependent methyltransferase [Aulosira sp. ZfuCHP01]
MLSPTNLTQDPEFKLHWQMTNCERFALQNLLRRLQPKLSVEIGTYRGGSLQVLSHFSEKVISVDIDPELENRLNGKFTNVVYCCGDSREVLPELVSQLNEHDAKIEFVLIDGDHSTAGVRRDIELLLDLKPRQRVVVIMHDSFNPDCRQGMKTAAWDRSPYVQWVELDFIPGIYHQDAYDTAAARTMWGGFACAVLEPIERKDELVISESQRGLFEAVFAVSAHANKILPDAPVKRLLKRLRRIVP